MQRNVFSDQSDRHAVQRVMQIVYHLLPRLQIRLRAGKMQTFADCLCQMLFFQHQRNFIERLGIQILQHVFFLHVTEQRDLLFHVIIQRIIGAADQNIRPDSHALQTLDAHLRRFGLHFPGRLQIRDQCHLDHDRIFPSDFGLELPDRL